MYVFTSRSVDPFYMSNISIQHEKKLAQYIWSSNFRKSSVFSYLGILKKVDATHNTKKGVALVRIAMFEKYR